MTRRTPKTTRSAPTRNSVYSSPHLSLLFCAADNSTAAVVVVFAAVALKNVVLVIVVAVVVLVLVTVVTVEVVVVNDGSGPGQVADFDDGVTSVAPKVTASCDICAAAKLDAAVHAGTGSDTVRGRTVK